MEIIPTTVLKSQIIYTKPNCKNRATEITHLTFKCILISCTYELKCVRFPKKPNILLQLTKNIPFGTTPIGKLFDKKNHVFCAL